MSIFWFLSGATAVLAFLASGERWCPPRGWGASPFGTDTRTPLADAVPVNKVLMPSGVSLAVRIVPATSEPHVLAVVLHGLCLNGTWYLGLAASMVSFGVTSIIIDLHGHGLSEGQRGTLPPRTILDVELAHAIVEIAKQHPGLPLLLIGHSAGAELLISQTIISRLEAAKLTVAGACGLAPFFSGRRMQKRFDICRPLLSLNPRGFFSRRLPVVRYNLPRTWSDSCLQTTFDRSIFRLSTSNIDPGVRLTALRKPVLLLVGENDAVISSKAVHALKSAQVRTLNIAHADHMSIIDHAAAVLIEIFIPMIGHHAQ